MGDQLQQGLSSPGFSRLPSSAQSPFEQQLNLPAGFGKQIQLQQLLGSSQQQQGFGTGFGGQNNNLSMLLSALLNPSQQNQPLVK